jgi:hypothetical protein
VNHWRYLGFMLDRHGPVLGGAVAVGIGLGVIIGAAVCALWYRSHRARWERNSGKPARVLFGGDL